MQGYEDTQGFDSSARRLVEETARAHHARMFAALVAATRDLDRAEEALQDAYADALVSWGRGALPNDAAAWLVSVARRRAIDRSRRDRARSRREIGAGVDRSEAADEPPEEALASSPIPDERLRLVFTCCHPALAQAAQVALTLRAVSGLSTESIARAFLVSSETMAQRLVRAKKKIREARIPFVVPSEERFGERLAAVLAVVYLVFNEGYSASEGDVLVRRDLCSEAISLGRLLVDLAPGEGDVHGLLALMTLLDARREARVDVEGLPLLLENQDRSRWDRAAIERGVLSIGHALRLGELGPYGLQAAIAAAHAEARSFEETPWARIVVLYDRLQSVAPTPVVRLNRIAAQAMATSPREALSELDRLESEVPALREYVWAATLRAELHARAQDLAHARVCFDEAIALAGTRPQREHLRRRRDAMGR